VVKAFIALVLVILVLVIALVVFVIADQRNDDCDEPRGCNALTLDVEHEVERRHPALA
jgi:hypothetical protein